MALADRDHYYFDESDIQENEDYPICSECGDTIDDDTYYEVEYECFCKMCMLSKFSRKTIEYRRDE